MAPHGPSSQSAYPPSRYEELYPPHQLSYSPHSHAQTSNEASYDSAVSYNEAPYQPPAYPAPQATRANSDRNLPALPTINTPPTFPSLPTYGMNSHFSPSPAQLSPTAHSPSPPGYEIADPFEEPQHLEEASHLSPPGLSGGHLGVAPHIQRSLPVFPGSTIGPQPPPLDVESLNNSGRRRNSVRSSEHSPTSSTSPSTSFRNSAVPSTASTNYESFPNDASTDNSHAPKESPVAINSFRRGRTRPKVQPLDWSKLSRAWKKEKTKTPQLFDRQSATSSGSEPLILSTLGEGQRMDIDTFCNTYSLPDNILQLFHAHAITATHAFSHITETTLTQMGFKIGEIIDLREAIKTWASSRESF